MTRVIVTHDLGREEGVVTGRNRPDPRVEVYVYTVRFADGTVSSWPEFRCEFPDGVAS